MLEMTAIIVCEMIFASSVILASTHVRIHGWVSFTIVGCIWPGLTHPGCILPTPRWITTNSASSTLLVRHANHFPNHLHIVANNIVAIRSSSSSRAGRPCCPPDNRPIRCMIAAITGSGTKSLMMDACQLTSVRHLTNALHLSFDRRPSFDERTDGGTILCMIAPGSSAKVCRFWQFWFLDFTHLNSTKFDETCRQSRHTHPCFGTIFALIIQLIFTEILKPKHSRW